MRKKKLLVCVTAALMLMGSFTGCGKKKDASKTEGVDYAVNVNDSSIISTDTDAIQLTKDGKVQSYLTGEWVDPSENERRPVTFMVNNISEAMPQSGVSSADIIYEILEEGGITRLQCVYSHESYKDLDKIGPLRSARHYYDRKALEFDAIFEHLGQSYLAQYDFDTISDLDQLDLNGKDGAYGYRDSSRVAPHNAYTSGANIDAAIEKDGFDTTLKDDFDPMFKFNVEDTDLENGTTANKITTEYNSGRKPYFEYDASTKTYLRYQYGGPQIDDTNNVQLSFKNVIVQFCDHNSIPNESLLIDVVLNGTGKGYYATNGKIIPITWEKGDAITGVTHYYTEDGKELHMNPGKTWVSVMQSDNEAGCVVE